MVEVKRYAIPSHVRVDSNRDRRIRCSSAGSGEKTLLHFFPAPRLSSDVPGIRLRERCLVGATNFPQSMKYREGSVFARRSAQARRATEAPRGGLPTWGGPESPHPLALRSSMLSRNFPISFRKVCSHPPAPARVSSGQPGAVNSFPYGQRVALARPGGYM